MCRKGGGGGREGGGGGVITSISPKKKGKNFSISWSHQDQPRRTLIVSEDAFGSSREKVFFFSEFLRKGGKGNDAAAFCVRTLLPLSSHFSSSPSSSFSWGCFLLLPPLSSSYQSITSHTKHPSSSSSSSSSSPSSSSSSFSSSSSSSSFRGSRKEERGSRNADGDTNRQKNGTEEEKIRQPCNKFFEEKKRERKNGKRTFLTGC